MTTVTGEHKAGLELALQRLSRHLAPENKKVLNDMIAQAGAAPEQEPVAWIYKERVWRTGLSGYVWADKIETEKPNEDDRDVKDLVPLYTHHDAEIERLRAELTTERLRADAAVGDANEAEQKLADAQALLRRVQRHGPANVQVGLDGDIDAFLSATAQPAEVKS